MDATVVACALLFCAVFAGLIAYMRRGIARELEELKEPFPDYPRMPSPAERAPSLPTEAVPEGLIEQTDRSGQLVSIDMVHSSWAAVLEVLVLAAVALATANQFGVTYRVAGLVVSALAIGFVWRWARKPKPFVRFLEKGVALASPFWPFGRPIPYGDIASVALTQSEGKFAFVMKRHDGKIRAAGMDLTRQQADYIARRIASVPQPGTNPIGQPT